LLPHLNHQTSDSEINNAALKKWLSTVIVAILCTVTDDVYVVRHMQCKGRDCEVPIVQTTQSREPTAYPYSVFLAASCKAGSVVILVLFFSISAAQRAAPTVLVNANNMLAIGTISNNVAIVPKDVYAPEC